MKRFLPVLLFALSSVGSLLAQESVIIKEPSEQCYQDLKANLPEAIRWDDNQRLVNFAPIATTLTGNVQLFARIFQEAGDTKCKVLVGIDSPTNAPALNAAGSSWVWKNAHVIAARIDSARQAREKSEKKKEQEKLQEKK